MTAAYNYIYYSSIPAITTTHYYVRFKVTNIYQLGVLDSLDLDLYDYPLDREIIQDGDYWPEAYAGLGTNDYPWLYTVVSKTFDFPSGIQKEILAPLNIPDDNPTLEDEAYYITNNSVCDSVTYATQREQIRETYRLAPIDPCQLGGILDECTGGGGVGSGGSSPKPKGQINFKTYSTNPGGKLGATAPLKYARVVGKRFLKIDKTYTDGNGNFVFKKRFPRKVTIVVKFKASVDHGQHSVRIDFESAGIWRSMFPLKKNIGTYKGNNLQNLNYEFQKGSSSIKRKTKQWLAAVIMNTNEESRLFLAENNLEQLPDDLRLYLKAPQQQHVNNPQYDFLRRSNVALLNQRRELFDDMIDFIVSGGSLAFITAAVASVDYASLTLLPGITGAGVFATLAVIFINNIPHRPDVNFYYKTSDVNSLTATKVSICAGQQLGIVYLYKLTNHGAPGASWETYMLAINSALNNHPYDTYGPFGNGIASSSPDSKPGVIAVWQSFAQHFGHTMADRLYGNGAGEFELQGKNWVSDINSSSNKKYLEGFNPQVGSPDDYFIWIPIGLINDLMDNAEPANSPVVDNVSGFTYQNIQNVLANKPSDILEFKALCQSISPAQTNQITQLFSSYGY